MLTRGFNHTQLPGSILLMRNETQLSYCCGCERLTMTTISTRLQSNVGYLFPKVISTTRTGFNINILWFTSLIKHIVSNDTACGRYVLIRSKSIILTHGENIVLERIEVHVQDLLSLDLDDRRVCWQAPEVADRLDNDAII